MWGNSNSASLGRHEGPDRQPGQVRRCLGEFPQTILPPAVNVDVFVDSSSRLKILYQDHIPSPGLRERQAELSPKSPSHSHSSHHGRTLRTPHRAPAQGYRLPLRRGWHSQPCSSSCLTRDATDFGSPETQVCYRFRTLPDLSRPSPLTDHTGWRVQSGQARGAAGDTQYVRYRFI
jgi:hypothetical protein